MTTTMDLVLKGGHVIDPANGIDGVRDVRIADGRIAAVGKKIGTRGAGEVIDVAGKLVLPGMIDTHAHVYQHVSGRFGLEAAIVSHIRHEISPGRTKGLEPSPDRRLQIRHVLRWFPVTWQNIRCPGSNADLGPLFG